MSGVNALNEKLSQEMLMFDVQEGVKMVLLNQQVQKLTFPHHQLDLHKSLLNFLKL